MPKKTISSSRRRPDNTVLFIILLPLVFLFGLGTGYSLWGGKAPAQESPVVAAQNPAIVQPTATTRIVVDTDDDPSLGPANAPITIVEFSDFQCPYCKRWNDEVLDRLMTAYPDQIRFVYRDFPLSFHPGAMPSAEAANCAGEQDAYWEYYRAIFTNVYNMDTPGLTRYASDLELDVEAFAACMEEHRYQAEVEADLMYAYSIGVQSTPTFYINGIKVEGAYPFDTFRQIIDQELAGND
jgi:protein-disulfide isomerase